MYSNKKFDDLIFNADRRIINQSDRMILEHTHTIPIVKVEVLIPLFKQLLTKQKSVEIP